MKISKLLFLTPVIALATVTPVVSCGKNNLLTVDDVEDAVFGHHDLAQQTPPKDTFIESLSTLSEKDKKKELLYAIYSPIFYLTNPSVTPWDTTTIYDLWKDKTIVLGANISKCILDVRDNKVYATFNGYITCVFQKEWDAFKPNNFIQFVFTFENCEVTPQGNTWYLIFNYGTPLTPPMCWGFAQAKTDDQTRLIYFDYIGYELGFDSFPHNWHNWRS